MSLPAGFRVGPYEIVDRLGAGGMGEVYRAKDIRLGREVALKVLPPELAGSPERLKRFEREARSASALNHPHIVVVHDLGREGGLDYLVMELVEGETLASRLGRGPLSLQEALELGRQLCSALQASHSQGVIHRDLKPGNIMWTRRGAKLLDFGLAAAVELEPADAEPDAATATGPLTREGAILGTLHYMAPEQLHGEPVDARTDIFALGAVLYEALTGRRPFDGDSRAEVARAILSSEPPPPSSLATGVPPAVDLLLGHCLAKDPEDRFHSAHDLGLQLASITSGSLPPPSALPSGQAGRRPRRIGLGVALSAVLAAGAGVALGVLWSPRQRAEPAALAVRFEFAPPDGLVFQSFVETTSLGVSPDGTQVAFIARAPTGPPSIWLRALDAMESRRVGGTEGATSLMWSPDGRELAYFTDRQLWRVGVDGGAAVPICELPGGVSRAGTWGEQDIVFTSVQEHVLFRVSADGGEPEILLQAPPSEGRPVWPVFLPDGRRLLYQLIEPDGNGRMMLWTPGREPRVVGPLASRADYVEPGLLVFVREGVLLAQAFDAEAGRLLGTPLALAPAVPYFLSTFWANFAASRAGTVVFQSQRPALRLAWFDREGREIEGVGEPGDYLQVSLSPDGEKLYFDRALPTLGTYDVWSLDLERGIETRLTSRPLTDAFPVPLPDGRTLVYSVAQGGAPRLIRRDLATGTETSLSSSNGFELPQDVSPDGRWLLFTVRESGTTFRLWRRDLESLLEPEPLLPADFGQWSAEFSPDARFIAFASDESGQREAYVMPVGSPAARVRISSVGASRLRWSADGSEIFVMSPDGRMFSVPIQTVPTLRVGFSEELFSVHFPSVVREVGQTSWVDFDVTRDGRRFIAVVPVDTSERQRLNVAVGAVPPEA